MTLHMANAMFGVYYFPPLNQQHLLDELSISWRQDYISKS